MALKETVEALGLTPNQAMDILQDWGVISDLCVHLEDIPDGPEADRAEQWLKESVKYL